MIQYRNASLSELRNVLEWAADEGWNPGRDDAEAFYAADPDGFFVAADQENEPVASISVVTHTADFAFLGLYIVRPAYRGRGIGLNLWTHALRHAGHRTVGLDGVEAQQDNYLASGFAHAGGTTRFTGLVSRKQNQDIRMAEPSDIETLIGLEAAASGVAKPSYLRAWFANSENRVTLILQGPTAIRGFCTVRVCQSGCKVGPLIADTTSAAETLIDHAATVFDDVLTLDVPETARGLLTLCRNLGMEPGFKTARMYRGPFAADRPDIFAVPSLELG